jgi:hypothetical protein
MKDQLQSQPISWPAVMDSLKEQGYSQNRLAPMLDTCQSSLSRLASGRTPEPGYKLGSQLLALNGSAVVVPEEYRRGVDETITKLVDAGVITLPNVLAALLRDKGVQ